MYISAVSSCNKYVGFSQIKSDIKRTGNNNSKTASLNLIPNNIYNKSIISFGQNKKDIYSYNEFIKSAKESGITSISALKAYIKPENLIGTGANSTVYLFDNPKLSNWVLKEDKKTFRNPCKALFEKTKDEFPNLNMGQEIAKAGDRYRILKKINGEVHAIYDWSSHINNNSIVSREEAVSFNNQLKTIADFPQETFDDYAQQLKTLSQYGYKQDSVNPNNLLIDYNKKHIQIIDSFKAVKPAHKNSKLDLISALLDFALFPFYHEKLTDEEQKQLTESSSKIANKCSIASQKAGINQDEKTYLNFIEDVDKYFGHYLVFMGGDYKSRYLRTKELLSEIV